MEQLREVVAHVGRLLPAQGPISVFIHHNLLHAFEGAPFEDAVAQAARIYGAEPYWPAERYRDLFQTGRITDDDLRDAIDESLGPGREDRIGGVATRRELAFVATRYGVPFMQAQGLEWHLYEEGAIRHFRSDLPPSARAAIAATGAGDRAEVARIVEATFDACVTAIRKAPRLDDAGVAPRRTNRQRDFVLDATGIDIDDEVHPLLVRFVAAYLDQGQSLWPMPDRDDGLFAAFVQTYHRRALAPTIGSWGRALVDLIEEEVRAARGSLASLAESLRQLGVAPLDHERFLLETALALRGWAGMVHQLELRPDRAPVWPVPASLVDFLAVRLLIERAALDHVARAHRLSLPFRLEAASAAGVSAPTVEERAFVLFHVAQLLGLDASRIKTLTASRVGEIERELVAHRRQHERRWLHAAFELHLRRRFLDAMSTHEPERPPSPRLQAVFCIDDREESIRRHLEEIDPAIETASTAGFFGVAMYHQGARDARPRPLAPVVITPRHFVPVERPYLGRAVGLAHDLDRLRAQMLHVGSRALLRGALVSIAGALSLVPLVLRVLFPRRFGLTTVRARGEGRIMVDRVERIVPPIGETVGFTVEEMVAIVERVLSELSLGGGSYAQLVVICGHAAESLNNPHRSAYDCGACGGGPGGANARAFCTMANRPDIRTALAVRGLIIPETTWFLAAEHNTTDDSVSWYDEDRVPATHAEELRHARESFARACRRNAEERCRRFAKSRSAPSGKAALDAVRARRWDLAEPRPEYNHATNAFCVVGRRRLTRGLFLDRRAFLVSYDPTRDDDDSLTLRRILDAIVPVVLGINLEYFFGAIDNEVYGSGTKLPHNVAALIGVMNGSQGDLRTGLWAQTVEIHEPVRVTILIETTPEKLSAVVASSASLSKLVRNRWCFLAAIPPDGNELHDFSSGEWRRHDEKQPVTVVTGVSADWFRGKRGHLGFATIKAKKERAL
jgi:uncharacterized protein YbcC (UPF0753/DUF2309 family)